MGAWMAMTAAACAATVAGCGTGRTDGVGAITTIASAPRSAACTAAAQAELVAIARRVYDQAATGRNTVSAQRRLGRSRALAVAVAAHDAAATRAALAPLIKHQITRVEVAAGGRVLARYGTTAAYGPARGTIRLDGRPVGTYVLAVSRDRDYAGLVGELTGATAAFRPAAAAGARATFPATTFPAGRAVVALTLPPIPASVCGPTPGDTRAATIGLAARRLLTAEQDGPSAHRAIAHAEQDPAFRAAVAAADPAAVRAAIVGFFRDERYHVVRVRVWNDAGVVNDVGGPYVVSPARGAIRDAGGAVVGRFMLAVQDDTGYIKLLHRFTGADVTLGLGGHVVPGSNVVPGPPFASGLRALDYHGRPWRAVGLTGTAFPSGALDVGLLVR